MSSFQLVVNSLCDLIFPCFGFFRPLIRRSPELPTSVVLEILLKLPIKSIIRCKLVCRSWYKLISDPYFSRNYLTNSPFTAIVRSEHRTISDPLDDASFRFLEIGRNGEVIGTPFSTQALSCQKGAITGIVGSCSGFLCLVKSPLLGSECRGNYINNRDRIYNNQIVCVVNPLSGEYMMLPDVNSAERIRDVVYGFSLSASADEYKVVRIVVTFLGIVSEIFTIGLDDRWRHFHDPCIPCELFACGVALNGILHWVGDDGHSGVIYAFDIVEESGCRISLPSALEDDAGNIDLAIWGDRLCLTKCHSDRQVDIWTMKQYRVVESWTRDFVLKIWIPSELRHHLFIPITALMNGDLLMSRLHGQSLMSFDPKTKECRKLDVPEAEGSISFSCVYTPRFNSNGNVFNLPEDNRL